MIRSFRTFPCLVGMLASLGGVRAQTDDFNDGNDAGWSRYSPLSAFGAGATYSFPAGAYRISAPASPSPSQLGPQRAGSLRAEATYTRARIAADIQNWNNIINQSLGLIARATKVGIGTLDGYTYNYNTMSGFHQITLVLGENPASQVDESPFRLEPTQAYRMVFTLVDEKILGQTFSATNPAVPLHSVFGLNETHASGTAGVFAFALNSSGPIDARFDNYVAVVPGKVRATMLDAAPAVGEQPADPIPTVVVRLANLETSIQTDSIRLEVDGQNVTFDLVNATPRFILTHTPGSPLSQKTAHTARVSFMDEDGATTFSWGFGAPAVVAPATLLGAANLEGSYQKEGAAVLDGTARKFTVPLTESQRFFRVSDATPRRVTHVERAGENLLIVFE